MLNMPKSASGLLCRSLGCTVVEMLTKNPPWHELEGLAVIYRIGTSDMPQFQLPAGASDVTRNFLARCFIYDPRRRPSAVELLRDPFIRDTAASLEWDPGCSDV